MGETESNTMNARERLQRTLPAVAGLLLFFIALEVLRRELHGGTWRSLSTAALNTPPLQLLAAALLTALNYIVLTGYDFIALSYIGRKIPKSRVVIASFIAYSISNNVGFSVLSGASVRYRFYSRWGISAEELPRIVFSNTVTFCLGLLTLGGMSLALVPAPASLTIVAQDFIKPLGWLLTAISAGYIALTYVRRKPINIFIGSYALPLPSTRLALKQFAISNLDWFLAGTVFFVLLPRNEAPFLAVLGAFLAAQLLGLISHVPGGVGVFEGSMVLMLNPYFTSAELVPSLVVFRAVYYLAPLSVALVLLVGDEIGRRRAHAAKVTAYLGRLTERLAPAVLAVFTFFGGVVLLFSGATPAAPGRLAFLHRVLPMAIIETSHVAGSAAGAALLLLSHGLARRLDAAYYFTVVTMSVGIVTSLLKGGSYAEAIFLAGFLLLLHRARPAFDRKAAFFATRFSPSWIAAVVAAVASSVWLGFFAFKHVEYSNSLWWQFERNAEASRFLRGTVGAATIVLLFALSRLLGLAPHETEEPSDEDLEAAGAIIVTQSSTRPYLVFLRDKAIMFDEQRESFLMYDVHGRTWVALGDPVGPPNRTGELIRLFLEKCDDFGGTPVFYEVGKDSLHLYADFGFTFVKLGEEGRVNLECFNLEGSAGSRYRQVVRRLEKDGGKFRLLPAAIVPSVMDQLRAVSDDWLENRAGTEKRFSLGFFEPEYIARFPVAVVERAGQIQAFATIWEGPEKQELSVDLMRFNHNAPRDIMEALFVHVMMWGKNEGFHWFSLGMAPMSGFEHSPTAPLWARVGIFLYEHGEPIYNFQGLRAFKEKFKPEWEARYLAYPGGLKLPRILADIAALVAGSYRRIFVRRKSE
jgi:phosphatidylglycerol lysyltransferase